MNNPRFHYGLCHPSCIMRADLVYCAWAHSMGPRSFKNELVPMFRLVNEKANRTISEKGHQICEQHDSDDAGASEAAVRSRNIRLRDENEVSIYRRILDNDMNAARREDPEDLFIKKEKRSRDTKDIKPIQSQKSARSEDGEHIQKTVIDLEQGDGDEG
ncbi:MAG: hypothetical protein EZS28_017790 [Streblomastix strix]|uniref:Uncharacterized protein n=1 Tax=Streblomastix strix TaxID=222440 RepID=A0A5J4VWH6_9EUKA|nr:MAG: hypothetical protein EZS28_017790 [Streblomastix strix]